MLWKLLGLQKLLDALFDEGWSHPCFRGHEGFCHEESAVLSQE